MTNDNPQSLGLIEAVVRHYETCLRSAGDEGQIVGWRDSKSQRIRFQVIRQLLADCQFASICDFGCGRGDLLADLRSSGFEKEYVGVDASQEMIAQAKERYVGDNLATFNCQEEPESAEIIVASGLFNVRLEYSFEKWEEYFYASIMNMWSKCRMGIVFNVLSQVSDVERRSPNLYYADPAELFRRCISISPDIRMAHHYGLFDMTIAIYRTQ